MAIIDMFSGIMNSWFVIMMRLLGLTLAGGLYVLLTVHVYAFFDVIVGLLKKRLGVRFGLIWCAIGLAILYNIIFNHFFAMTVKPGSPVDLDRVEKLRQESKQREHRKAVRVVMEDGADGQVAKQEAEDDRFEGLQKDVK